MYPLFETIAVENGEIKHAFWHKKRFENSYFFFYKQSPLFDLFEGVKIPEKFNTGLVKLRISYNLNCKEVHYSHYKKNPINSLKIVMSDDILYHHKWSDRRSLNALYAKKGVCDDILIVKNGKVTDSSYTSIIFYDEKEWFTSDFPLLRSTTITRLLSEQKVKSKTIGVDDIQYYSHFKLINALRDIEQVESIPIDRIIV